MASNGCHCPPLRGARRRACNPSLRISRLRPWPNPWLLQCRCQKYHFGKLKESEIAARLQALAEKENLDVDEAALRLISSRADGSLRDAESMLDQLSLLDQTITLSMVQELVSYKLYWRVLSMFF